MFIDSSILTIQPCRPLRFSSNNFLDVLQQQYVMFLVAIQEWGILKLRVV